MSTTTDSRPVTDPRTLPAQVADAVVTHRDEAEQIRRMPRALLEVLRDARMFRLQLPVELGGFECDLATALDVYEALGRLDGSVAWNVWNGNLGIGAAFMHEDGARLIWGDGPDVVVANSARPVGVAKRADGGFVLSGRWDIVSAIDAADWTVLFGVVFADGAPVITPHGAPDVRAFYLPKRDVTVLDTWHVGGMRGSGSNTAVVDGAFVPDVLAPSPFAPARIDRTPYRIPIFTSIAIGIAGACLGIAQSAIDEVLMLAPTKSTGAGCVLADLPSGQAAIAEADARLRAARLLVHDAADGLTCAAGAGAPITDLHRAHARAAMTHVAQTSRAVVNSMFELASSSSLYTANRIERIFRDANAAAQHGLLNAQTYVSVGRVLLGKDPGTPVF